MTRPLTGAALLVGLALLPAGCGGGNAAIVEGSVTYDGEPVNEGTITFLPANGTGPSIGGPISDGRYSVVGVAGSKIVKITGAKPVKNAPNSTDLDTISVNARGNNVTVEVKPGRQTHDFALTKPVTYDDP